MRTKLRLYIRPATLKRFEREREREMAVEIQGTYRNGHYVVWFEEHVIETTVTASGAVAASLVMGVPMEKPHQVCVSAWDARRLTYDQLKYACADAFASYEVGRMLYDGEY
ncbi:hypothetical protein PR202_ga09750 [Eleusine coracana subsp. coracana]|uniref:Uncharacterized protein n=1 Tax=Eleusine coracana subsp. coracana TaxID=191504 RepID=A0AAV5C4H0_ELECO|nr:hypothetical protein PR202_ga09750 [Eleusine coracana subsp. coracana]